MTSYLFGNMKQTLKIVWKKDITNLVGSYFLEVGLENWTIKKYSIVTFTFWLFLKLFL
jgi:hypothetical protein